MNNKVVYMSRFEYDGRSVDVPREMVHNRIMTTGYIFGILLRLGVDGSDINHGLIAEALKVHRWKVTSEDLRRGQLPHQIELSKRQKLSGVRLLKR